jgi:hypothetical protein
VPRPFLRAHARSARAGSSQRTAHSQRAIASLFATLNDMFGNRMICGIERGDSARRVLGKKPATLAHVDVLVQKSPVV